MAQPVNRHTSSRTKSRYLADLHGAADFDDWDFKAQAFFGRNGFDSAIDGPDPATQSRPLVFDAFLQRQQQDQALQQQAQGIADTINQLNALMGGPQPYPHHVAMAIPNLQQQLTDLRRPLAQPDGMRPANDREFNAICSGEHTQQNEFH